MTAKKRERLEVIHDILKSIQKSMNHIKPTRLLYDSNLSPKMFKEYVKELSEKEFICEECEKGRKTFSLTDKGFNFIEKYSIIIGFVNDFGL